MIKREGEKILKYKEFTIDTQRMCNVQTKVIPVIIQATVTFSTSLTKYLSNVPPKHIK